MSQQQVKIVAGVPVFLDTTTGQFSATIPGGREMKRKDLRLLEREIEKSRSWEGIKVVFTGYEDHGMNPAFVTDVEMRDTRTYGMVDAWVLADGQRVRYGTPRHWDDVVMAGVAAIDAEVERLRRERRGLIEGLTYVTAEMVRAGRATALGLATTTEGEQH